MNKLLKDQFKKIKENLVSFITMSFLVVIIALIYTAIHTSVSRLDENYESYLENQKLEDFYFVIDEIDVNYLSGTAFTDLCQDYAILEECGIAVSIDSPESMNELNVLFNQKIKEDPQIYEAFLDSYMSYFEDQYDFIIEKQRVQDVKDGDYLYKFVELHETINLPYLVEGKLPTRINEIMVFPEFAQANGIEINDVYQINDLAYVVTGFAYSVDFIYPIFNFNTITYDPQYQTLIFTTSMGLDALEGDPSNKYAVLGDLSQIVELESYTQFQNLDKSTLGKHMQMVSILMPSTLNYRVITLPLEVENAKLLSNLFITIFLGITLLLLLILLKRYIDKYRHEIKILNALGYTSKEIAISYMVFPFFISLSSIIGYVLGFIISNNLFDLYSKRYLIGKATSKFDLLIFVVAIIMPILIINIISYFMILKEITHTKETSHRRLKILKFIPLKTIIQLSTLFVFLHIIILIGLNSNQLFSDFTEHTKVGNNYKEMIQLKYFTDDPVDSDYETFTYIRSTILNVNNQDIEPISTTIYGIDPSIQLKALINNDPNNNNLLNEGVIVSEYIADLLDLNIDDQITYTIGSAQITYRISGISNELIESNIFMKEDDLHNIYGLDSSFYNGVYTTDTLYESPDILQRIDYIKGLNEFTSILSTSSIIMNFISILSFIIGIYILFALLLLYSKEQEKHMALLEAIGYDFKEIQTIYYKGIFYLLVIAYIIALPFTYFLLDFLLKSMTNIIGFKLLLVINPVNIVIGIFIFSFIYILIRLIMNLYNQRTQIQDSLKSN